MNKLSQAKKLWKDYVKEMNTLRDKIHQGDQDAPLNLIKKMEEFETTLVKLGYVIVTMNGKNKLMEISSPKVDL